MNTIVLICGNLFDGVSDTLTGPAEILVEQNRIPKIERSVERPPGARVIELSERTVCPGFIDKHVQLADIAATSTVDFVMKDGVVYRAPEVSAEAAKPE